VATQTTGETITSLPQNPEKDLSTQENRVPNRMKTNRRDMMRKT